MAVWVIFIGISSWGAANLDIDFKQTYFISASAYINEYIERQDLHYKSGETITVYVDNADTDFTTIESQQKLNTLIDQIKTCKDCSQDWIKEDTFDSWYVQLKAFSQANNNAASSACEGSWDS